MIHTQYYALMRGIAEAVQMASPETTINQWDYNFNSKTFDSLKLHRNPKAYPKAVVNINSSKKIFNYSLNQNATVGMNGADLVQYPNAFPVASVEDKYEIYALTNRYDISMSINIHFETAAQMLDFYHNYSEYFPSQGKYFYDFKYDYYLYLPSDIISDFDPENDEAINIFAVLKDDASNYKLFAKCEGTPLLRCDSVDMNQDKQGDNHTISLNFTIQDSFVYLLMKVDHRYWINALTLSIIIQVQDYDESTVELEKDGPYTINDEAEPDWETDASADELGENLEDTEDTNNDTDIEIISTGETSSSDGFGAL